MHRTIRDKMKKIYTLCIVHQHPRVLLGMKKRGFGSGRWNGFGGKLGEGETVEKAALRELEEECGIKALHMEKLGVLEFAFENDPKKLETHVFRVNDFEGDPLESDEMRPQWFNIDEIPFVQMWPDDIYWMPLFLKGHLFRGKFLFDRPSDQDYSAKIISQELARVEELGVEL